MPKYVIEGEMPGAGKLTVAELQAVAQISCSVMSEMEPQLQWVHSYVTNDKIYTVLIAPDDTAVREHAQRSGLPANKISVVAAVINPATAVGKRQ